MFLYVHRKDYVHKEAVAARNWESKWGFLKSEYTTVSTVRPIYIGTLHLTVPLCLYIIIMTALQLKNDMNKSRPPRGAPLPEATESPREAPLKLPPLSPRKQDTSRPFPMRDSQLVGWRSGDTSCALEVFGRWGRPKWSIVKQLKWPNDGVP